MRCPQDVDVDLVMTERQGVEIDYCPSCRGVWLDRGELDKILDRAAAQQGPAAPQGPAWGAARSGGAGATGPDRPRDGDTRYGETRYGDARDDSPPRYDSPRRYDDDRRGYGEVRRDDDRSRYEHGGHPRKKHKESWLGDLLDFG